MNSSSIDGFKENPNLPSNIQKELIKLRKMEYAINQSTLVAIFDRNGRMIYVNNLICEVTQYSRDELIGQFHAILYSNETDQSQLLNMVETLKGGQNWKGELINQKKDGSKFWVHTNIVPIFGNDEEPYQYYSISNEITKEKEFEKEALRNSENYRLIAENSINLIALIDIDGTFRYVSPTFNSILNYDVSKLESGNFFHIIHPKDLKAVKDEVRIYCRKRKEPILMEFCIQTENGDYIDIEATIRLVDHSSYSSHELMLVVMRDIRNRKKVERKIYHLAYHDTLTDFPNRRSFMNRLSDEILARKNSNDKLAILFIDLDNFKYINDQWGHDKGDLVIKEAAEVIQSAIRGNDIAARLGGDEFIVMLKGIANEQETIAIVKNIQEKFKSPLVVENQEFIVTTSIGIAIFPDHGSTSEELIKNADDALYTVKSQGKNSFLIFNESIEHQSLERRLLENALRYALKKEQFYLEYQPKLNISTNELIGMEALLRWKHPDLGVIPPLKFITLAESTGLILPLGEWILRESCRQTKEWHDKGFSSLCVSVNISVRQLDDPYFMDKVKNILKETGLDPKFLEFEVTESIFADLENTISILHEVRNIGIQISIDDFGTGYSSLSYIKHLPIDTLKVDQSFIKDIHINQESKAIVLAVLNLAKTIGLNVIAEGIETKEHVETLSEDGLEFGQGYYYSKPLKKDAFEEFINNNTPV
nr:bifunctional diguanylate cyclase/phosphodiesterase [Lysinibacillus timonensis]